MGKKIGNVLFIVSLLFLVAGGILLFQKIHGYHEAGKMYDDVRESATAGDAPEEFTVDWESFAGTDVVAWIKAGDKISYPVLQGNDNSKYLHHLYNGKYNYAGSIFLHCDCEPDFTSRNSIIYGHNMRNGSMFGSLKQYVKKMDDPYFYLYLPDGTRHTYQICSAANVTDGSKAYMYRFEDMDAFADYQEYMLKKSAWDTGLKPETENDTKLVSLSTCASIGSKQGRRVMVQGIERDVCQVQEPASWYMPENRGIGETESMEAALY